MQRPTLLEGIIVALVISLIISPLGFMLRLWLGGGMGGKAWIVMIAYAYIVYLLMQSPRPVGRTLLAGLSALALLGSLALETRWIVLAAMTLIAGIRACAYSQGLLSAFLHGSLCLCGFGTALWAYWQSGSLLLATWSFFLLQALFVWIPSRLRSPASASQEEVDGEDGFRKAHQAAQQALARLHTRTVA
jgi:hypothetical protein